MKENLASYISHKYRVNIGNLKILSGESHLTFLKNDRYKRELATFINLRIKLCFILIYQKG